MGCGNFGTEKILVGLHLVGVTGIRSAFQTAEKSGLRERNDLLDLIIETVAVQNYTPPVSPISVRIRSTTESNSHTAITVMEP